jgi:hypothetical protein
MEQLRDDISENCRQLIHKSKQLIEQSREILTAFQLAKQRCAALGLVTRKSKAASASPTFLRRNRS